MAAELVNALTAGENLELQELLANSMSTSGQLVAFFGVIVGGAVLGAVASVVGIAAVIFANDWRQRIDLERYLRGTTTPSPPVPTTLDPSKLFMLWHDLIFFKFKIRPK